jgi:sulfoxide reductase heme-binding subunit YedZ
MASPKSAPTPWLAPGFVLGGLVPLGVLLVRALRGTLGADPVAIALNQLGLLAFVLLVASLAATPLRLVFGWSAPMRVRKTLGLLAFFYACAHFALYLVLDRGLDLGALAEDLTKRPFVLVGAGALTLLVPLAVTSTKGMVRRLGGKRWQRLHRLVYLAVVLALVHFFWRFKTLATEPIVYAAIVALLFAVRLGAWLRTSSTRRRAAGPSAGRS